MDHVDGNKVIEGFLGWRFIKLCGAGIGGEIPMYQRFDESGKITHPGIFHVPDFFKWESIMPVVEKLEALPLVNISVNISRNTVDVSVEDGDIIYHGSTVHDESKLSNVWQAVIAAIQWYSQQPNPSITP